MNFYKYNYNNAIMAKEKKMTINEFVCLKKCCPYFKRDSFGGHYCAKSGIDWEEFQIPEDCPYIEKHKLIQRLEGL